MYKNIKFIQKSLLKRVGFILVSLALFLTIFGQHSIAISILIGGFFSYLSFRQLLKSQSTILQTADPKQSFLPLLFRLGIYGIPITLGLFYSNYLKVWVILIFLLSFQVTYVVWELLTNMNRYKKRQK